MISGFIIGILVGGLIGTIVQLSKDCDMVSASELENARMQGYVDGYHDAIVDVLSGNITDVLCNSTEMMSVEINGKTFALSCVSQEVGSG